MFRGAPMPFPLLPGAFSCYFDVNRPIPPAIPFVSPSDYVSPDVGADEPWHLDPSYPTPDMRIMGSAYFNLCLEQVPSEFEPVFPVPFFLFCRSRYGHSLPLVLASPHLYGVPRFVSVDPHSFQHVLACFAPAFIGPVLPPSACVHPLLASLAAAVPAPEFTVVRRDARDGFLRAPLVLGAFDPLGQRLGLDAIDSDASASAGSTHSASASSAGGSDLNDDDVPALRQASGSSSDSPW